MSDTKKFAAGLVPETGGEANIDISNWACPPDVHLVWLKVDDYRSNDDEATLVLSATEARELAHDLIVAAHVAEQPAKVAEGV